MEEASEKRLHRGKAGDRSRQRQHSRSARDAVATHEEERLAHLFSKGTRKDRQSLKKTAKGRMLSCGVLWNRLGCRLHKARGTGSVRATVSGGEEYVPVQKDVFVKEENNKEVGDRELELVSVVQVQDAEDTKTLSATEGQQRQVVDGYAEEQGGQGMEKTLPWWSWRGDTTSHAAKLLMKGKLKMFYENHHR